VRTINSSVPQQPIANSECYSETPGTSSDRTGLPQENHFSLHLICQTMHAMYPGLAEESMGLIEYTTTRMRRSFCIAFHCEWIASAPCAMPTHVPRNDARVVVRTWRPPSGVRGLFLRVQTVIASHGQAMRGCAKQSPCNDVRTMGRRNGAM
jgi:hypothetical protein